MKYVGRKTPYTAVNVAFLVAPDKRILHVTPPFPATCADSVMQTLDFSVQQLQKNSLYTEHPVQYTASDGSQVQKKGLTFLVDGGYPQNKIFQTGGRSYQSIKEGCYCAYLDHVQEDVQRTFRLLKSRFHILKHGMRISNAEFINCCIATCAGLHNELIGVCFNGIIIQIPSVNLMQLFN
jgi:hypothetical protein